MNTHVTHVMAAGLLAVGLGAAILVAQSADTAASHRAAAKAAAGQDFPSLLSTTCPEPAAQEAAAAARGRAGGAAAGRGRGAGTGQWPARELWHAEPAKVFDNLYFVGQTEYSAWAVVTSAGIIIIDTIFDYSVEDEVVGGLKKLGLDPASIKYRRRQPRAFRPFRRREVPPGQHQGARDDVGGRLGSARSR